MHGMEQGNSVPKFYHGFISIDGISIFAVCSYGNTWKPTKGAQMPINNTILITLYLCYLYCIEDVPHTENTNHTCTIHEYLQNYPFIYYIKNNTIKML